MELYRKMAANVPDCSIYVFDENYDYLLAEGEEIAKMGLAPDAFNGTNFFEVWPNEITRELGPYYQQTLEGKRQKLEKYSDGNHLIQHFIPIKNESDEVFAGMVVSQNISELKNTQSRLSDAELELKQNEELLKAVIESIGEGIMVARKNGDILLSNPAAERILGMPMGVESLRDVERLLAVKRHPDGDELDPSELPLSIAFQGGKVDDFVTFNELRQFNRRFYVESSARPVKMGKGAEPAAVIVMRDISQRKELDNLVDDQLTTLQDQVERFKRMLSTLSHNMRGPSANLSILLSLYERSDDEEEKTMFLSKIKEVSGDLQKSTASLGAAISAYSRNEGDWGINSFDDLLNSFQEECEDLLRQSKTKIEADFEKAKTLSYPAAYLKSIFFNVLRDLIVIGLDEESIIKLISFEDEEGVFLKVQSEQVEKRLLKFMSSTGEIRSPADFHKIGYVIAKNQLELLGSNIEIRSAEEILIKF